MGLRLQYGVVCRAAKTTRPEGHEARNCLLWPTPWIEVSRLCPHNLIVCTNETVGPMGVSNGTPFWLKEP